MPSKPTSYHPVDGKCSKKGQEQYPSRDIPYHQSCHKAEEC